MKRRILLVAALLISVAPVFADYVYKSEAVASYYADKFHGRKTSNGETFNMYALTAAHKTLPFNTKVVVTNLSNGKSVTVESTTGDHLLLDVKLICQRQPQKNLT